MTTRTVGSLFAFVLLLALPAAAHAGGKVASATGVKQVHGQTVYVDVIVAVPRGHSARQATGDALARQGARRQKPPWAGPPGGGGGGGGGGGEDFAYTGLKWDPASVLQNYNPTNEPLAALDALTDTHATWNAASRFRFAFGDDDVTRCPSLVQQCKGPQVTDGFNDVGWASIGGSTLGVTWWTTSNPEADMALNTRFAWTDTCTDSGNTYDVESVFLHENGHVAGLDHTNNTQSVMYPSYQSARCTLFQYDRDAMAHLYG